MKFSSAYKAKLVCVVRAHRGGDTGAVTGCTPQDPLSYLRRTEQKEIPTSFLELVATPHKVAKVIGPLSLE